MWTGRPTRQDTTPKGGPHAPQQHPPQHHRVATTVAIAGLAGLLVDDDSDEYLQVAAGMLVGVALAGAGAALVSRRDHSGLTWA